MKYIYGPVQSRRLGFSLGLSLTPYKVCSLDCVYCQLGKTSVLTLKDQEYIPISEIIDEFKSWLAATGEQYKKLSYITISGSGEPTLNTKIGDLISQLKAMVNISVALITNSTLLSRPEIRRQCLGVDLIVPSLDAVTQEIFDKVDRPAKEINIEEVIVGLVALRREFRGKIWLEIMLVKGINDDIRHIKKFLPIIELINPDKIQLNSPVRATTESNLQSLPRHKLETIKHMLGDKCEII
ncbi:MAG: radical SAM protein [Candidatus Omnitrophica bacterium]|nr:radical SAM protein [Candidatus Omnitrophota bacterium]